MLDQHHQRTTIGATTSTTDAGNSDTRATILAMIEADKTLNQSAISKQVDISATALSQFLAGKYTGDNLSIERKLLQWVDTYESKRAQAAVMPKMPGYVATPTAERVMASLRYAHMAGDMTMVYGGAGLGKTQAAKQYQRTAPNVFIATMTPASCSVVPALEVVAAAVGASHSGGGAQRIFAAVCRRLQNSQALLVIDETQHLNTQALDQIRSIHDAVEIGLALIGNTDIYARMTGGNRAAALDRLHSRIGKRDYLKTCQPGDVSEILKAWNIEDEGCRKLLADIAARPGALRGMSKVLRLAATYAAAEQRGMKLEDVRAAARELAGAA